MSEWRISDVEMIRNALRRLNPRAHTSDASWEALERLGAENTRLRGALEEIAGPAESAVYVEAGGGFEGLQAIARRALTQSRDSGSVGGEA